jgi:hypothetical protein
MFVHRVDERYTAPVVLAQSSAVDVNGRTIVSTAKVA